MSASLLRGGDSSVTMRTAGEEEETEAAALCSSTFAGVVDGGVVGGNALNAFSSCLTGWMAWGG